MIDFDLVTILISTGSSQKSFKKSLFFPPPPLPHSVEARVQSLSRDAVLLILSTNNTQERLVTISRNLEQRGTEGGSAHCTFIYYINMNIRHFR